MGNRWIWIGIAVALLVVWVVLVAFVNRNRSLPPMTFVPTPQNGLQAGVGNELTISTWNLGYAGLGADADFLKDGGQMMRAPSRASAEANLAGILSQIEQLNVDVMLFQEMAGPSLLNRHVPLVSSVLDALPDRQTWWNQEVDTWGLPWPLRLTVGGMVASRIRITEAQRARLPEEAEPLAGLLNRSYSLQVLHLDAEDGPGWSVINLHLSAFDDGGALRIAQIEALLAVAEAEYASGRHVVLGGDWNMILTPTDFPHQTAEEHLFWLHDFPVERIPEGWTLVFDPEHPTVRTNHKPYVAGENYTTIIDGFLVSPNVEVLAVQGIDTGFVPSDHMPVTVRLAAR